MATWTHTIDRFDPFLYTGPSRLQSDAVARSGPITVDVPYGTGGNPEFATRLYVGVAGDVTIVKWDGTTEFYKNLAQGRHHIICSTQVLSSGTTATNMVWGS